MTGASQAAVPEGGPDWGAPRARAVQWYDPAIAVARSGRSGLEFLRALRDGKLPPPPIAA